MNEKQAKITRIQFDEISKIIKKHYEACVTGEEDDSVIEAVCDYLTYVINDIEQHVE